MGVIREFFFNYVLVSAILAWMIAQFLKIFTVLFTTRKFHIKYMFSNGGMPSSHSATVMALCIACGIQEGVASPYFAIAAILAVIVMNDASGVRYETGKQATILNRITKELFAGNTDGVNTQLKELVGHTPFQVLMGGLLGIAVAVCYAFLCGVL